ncbi:MULTISPECIES: polysaccharide deacetylase family protein [unclassified Clostridioides]|uniref:polysaccharide deacetylase family protein n=1 Tax=unclassified Clostridioides TaxID=2635829 RepID=UPI0038AA56D9
MKNLFIILSIVIIMSISNFSYAFYDTNLEYEKNNSKISENTSKYYEGKIEHVFVHPLIVYPEMAFDGDYESKTFSKWFVTTKEFKKILDNLYQRNFILVSYKDVYEEKEVGGKKLTVRKKLLLPEGKKPIIISIDDINYNQYMLGNGITEKIVLDRNNELAGYIKKPNGKYLISTETEMVPLIEDFVKLHPDFSHNNAKGVLAVTGFEGILGYRIQRDYPNRNEELKQCKRVVYKLKENGWEFASHSYGHPNLKKISLEKLRDDTIKWEREVQSVVGKTKIYIPPYGEFPNESSKGLEYLQSKGFTIFAGVGPISYEKIYKDKNLVITDRRNIDGITLLNKKEKFLDLYNADKVIDYNARKVNK